MPGRLVLASASSRRKEILAAAGIDCDVLPSSVEERQTETESTEDFVRRIAWEKANEVLSRLPTDSGRTVLGGDTVVLVNGLTLGKPQSAEDATRMLRMLSGREHRVLTGVCLLYTPAGEPPCPDHLWKDIRAVSTTVRFSPLSEREIADYVATGEPFGKAGAYAIQGRASKFVERIEGCYSNVVGLPVATVYQMLKNLESAIKEKPLPLRSKGSESG
ncbi:MAG: septum formation protein Maf [Acidobacteria bacterium]|nr:septum formation protein Maf [Acidobacteriota bacterium]